jgi:hypothetical protein
MAEMTDEEWEAFRKEASLRRAAYEAHRKDYAAQADVFLKKTIDRNKNS